MESTYLGWGLGHNPIDAPGLGQGIQFLLNRCGVRSEHLDSFGFLLGLLSMQRRDRRIDETDLIMTDPIPAVGCDQSQQGVALGKYVTDTLESILSSQSLESIHDLAIDQNINVGSLLRRLTEVTNHRREDQRLLGSRLGFWIRRRLGFFLGQDSVLKKFLLDQLLTQGKSDSCIRVEREHTAAWPNAFDSIEAGRKLRVDGTVADRIPGFATRRRDWFSQGSCLGNFQAAKRSAIGNENRIDPRIVRSVQAVGFHAIEKTFFVRCIAQCSGARIDA